MFLNIRYRKQKQMEKDMEQWIAFDVWGKKKTIPCVIFAELGMNSLAGVGIWSDP